MKQKWVQFQTLNIVTKQFSDLLLQSSSEIWWYCWHNRYATFKGLFFLLCKDTDPAVTARLMWLLMYVQMASVADIYFSSTKMAVGGGSWTWNRPASLMTLTVIESCFPYKQWSFVAASLPHPPVKALLW